MLFIKLLEWNSNELRQSVKHACFKIFAYAILVSGGFVACAFADVTAEPKKPQNDIYARENLVAWCIVPFDSKKRDPEKRAQMLARLGFSKFAYDYRAEHVPTFEAELVALARHHIELTAWWFPGELNDEARGILSLLKKRGIKTQLWVMGGGDSTKTEEERRERVKAESARIRPIAEEAAKIGCRVGLYNHGGWFGEPENQIAIIQELKLPNVGIVYNLHHGHSHLARFPTLLKQMLPYLYAINLNGMTRDGEQHGLQIMPLGQGDLDLSLLRTIRDSGYSGPIGILGHTQDDAEERLRDNLDGLAWLVKQLNGQPAGERPKPRTFTPPKTSTNDLPKEVVGKREVAVSAPVPAAGLAAAICTPGQPLEYDPKLAVDLVIEATSRGNARRGMAIFTSARFGCLNCHHVGNVGGSIGPVLSDVGKRLKVDQIAEAVLWPKRLVAPEFSTWQVVLADGRTVQGYKRAETSESLQLFDPAQANLLTIPKVDIDAIQEMGTVMPEGMATAMSTVERRDLIRFLSELGNTTGLENEVRAEEVVAEFNYDRAPLHPEDWPHWQHRVNRDRVYDFYLKEALFFRDQPNRPHLLPAYPGLDGGKYGHWGNQNEDAWKDNRWNDTQLGTVLAGVFRTGGTTVPKGVCVRLGELGELATCFDPETMSYTALWRGGFVKFSEIRHGFLDGLTPIGDVLPKPEGKPPQQPFVYHGYYRYGSRIVFAYRVGDVEMLDAPWVRDGKFERVVAPLDQHPLRDAVRGGPPQWPQILKTGGELGAGRPYAVDTIKLPFENPWKALVFVGDHDFLPDGSALVCTMQGDVWRVTGIDNTLEKVRWRRFASGLHQPLGLVVNGGDIYVLGRDQITRLQDLNNDGEADFYECYTNKYITSPGGHDFICGLSRDAEGRFYTASGKQGLLRISKDGTQVEVLATGLRNPDGLALLPDGSVTVPCSEGEWTPASMVCCAPPRKGSTPIHFGYGGPLNGEPPALPLAYLPRGLDNNSAGQVVVPDDRWGPMRDQLILLSFGAGTHFLVLRDEVDGQQQGAVVPLVGDFRAGVHRGKFNPRDGQLYVSGLTGWGTYTPDDGCFQRLRYTGDPVQLPRYFHIHENGVLLSFKQPIDPAQLADDGKQFAQVWNYRYSMGYGSQEYAPSHPGVVGHETLDIAGVHLIDPTTIFVELPDLQPVNQLHLVLRVDAGRPQELIVTVHKLDKPFTQFPGYRPMQKIIAAHPTSIDLTLLGKMLPNPWLPKIENAVKLNISAGKNLSYSTRTLRAKAGEPICLTMDNPDSVPHNWVLVKPGALSRVGDLANRLVADPEAVLHQYVPKTDDVLAYTDITPPQQIFKIFFYAPKEKGRYPFLCSFPGHWMAMNGELIVE